MGQPVAGVQPDHQPMSTATASTLSSLKQKIQAHYDVCSSYYYSLWGEHVHHGYFTSPTQTKEDAQRALIELLLERASIIPKASPSSSSSHPLRVLDTGCGLGGTSRYLAKECGFNVTGITISSEQVKMAYQLSRKEAGVFEKVAAAGVRSVEEDDAVTFPSGGSVRFIQMDAETMGERFEQQYFDVVWICEALSHFPDKPLFFRNAVKLLRPGGKLVMADWFRAVEVEDNSEVFVNEIQPIEEGMLLPPLGTMSGYTDMAEQAGFIVCKTDEPLSSQGRGWKDISKEVAKTWDISLQLVASPSLWALAFSQGRDFVSFLKAFQAMRKGFATGSFRYGVAAFKKGTEGGVGR